MSGKIGFAAIGIAVLLVAGCGGGKEDMSTNINDMKGEYKVFIPILNYCDVNDDGRVDGADDPRFAGKGLHQIIADGTLDAVVSESAAGQKEELRALIAGQKSISLSGAQREKVDAFANYAAEQLKTAITWVNGPGGRKVPGGFFATNVPMEASADTISNYRQIFTRDACITILGALTTDDETILAASKASLTTLAAVQGDTGLMPEAAKYDANGRPIPSTPVGGVIAYDANPLFIIASSHYFDKTGDKAFLKEIFPKVAKAMNYMLEISKNDVTFNISDGNNWMDRAHGQYGNPATIQGLYAEALESYDQLHKYVKRHHPGLIRKNRDIPLVNDIEKGKLDVTELVGRIETFADRHMFLTPETYLTYVDRVMNQFNKAPAPKIENSVNPFNVTGVLFAEEIEFKKDGPASGYLASSIRTHILDSRFDSWAHIVWMLGGRLDQEEMAMAVEHVDHNGIDEPYPIKVIYPPAHDATYEIFCGNDPQNVPGTYQNGGIWPYQGLYYISALKAAGLNARAVETFFKMSDHMMELDEECPMAEWLETGKGDCGHSEVTRFGKKKSFGTRTKMAWASGGALAATYSISTGKNPFDFSGYLAQ